MDPQTRTGRYAAGRSPKAGFDGVTFLPAGTFSDPSFIPRLSWQAPARKTPFDWGEVCATVESAPAGTTFVCDTSLFDDDTDARLWPALLNSPGKLVFTPRVEIEMGPWFSRRPGHPVKRALDGADGAVRLEDYDKWSDAERNSYVRYVNLLGSRKSAMKLGEMRFQQKHGRAPADGDIAAVRADVQRLLGERGYLFARKGAASSGSRSETRWTDEEVVYTALAHALRTGSETFVLTKDEDLLDQLYRLVYLVDTHYRSMLIADAYLRDFGSFRTHPMPTAGPWAEAFTGQNNVLIERPWDLPNQVLPAGFSFVAVHCLVLGKRLSSMTFGAEREMHKVLEVKGSTDGRNSRALLPRNVHLRLPEFAWPEEWGPCFAIGEDRCVKLPDSGLQIPYVDCVQAILTSERFEHFEERHPLL